MCGAHTWMLAAGKEISAPCSVVTSKVRWVGQIVRDRPPCEPHAIGGTDQP